MPARETLKDFIALVEAGRHVEAIEAFYHPDASMQENLLPPRLGRDALVAHERRVLQGVREVRSRCPGPPLVEGDLAVVRWVFDFVDHSGRRFTLDEVACQEWRGERILRERFYYDPAQVRP